MLYEVLKARAGMPSDLFTMLWAKKMKAIPEQEITGTLPLSFIGRAQKALTNYRLYGTSEGAGVACGSGEPEGYKIPLTLTSGQTSDDYNLYIGSTKLSGEEYVDYQEQKVYKRTAQLLNSTIYKRGYSINAEGVETETSGFVIYNGKAAGNTEYTLSFNFLEAERLRNCRVHEYDVNGVWISQLAAGANYTYPKTFTTSANAAEIRAAMRQNNTDAMLNEGSTAETYAPYFDPQTPPSPLPAITAYQGENTLSSAETVGEVTVKGRIRPLIYGWHVDPSISDPAQAITYLEDAIGKTPAAMGSTAFSYGDWQDAFFMPKPCMLKSDGTVDYYLDPNDYSKKLDGTASDYNNLAYDGNVMIEFPKIYYKYEAGEAEGEGYFYCSNYKVDDSYECWCNYDCDDNVTEHFYVAAYNGIIYNNKMRSISGYALTASNGNGNTNTQQEIQNATANNTTAKVEWYTDVWSDRMLINGLLILMGKSIDAQSVYGQGLSIGGQAVKETVITGTHDSKGLFYGDIANTDKCIKVFGVENWWGCAWRRVAGLIGTNDGKYAVKLTYGVKDGTFANGYNLDGAGYKNIGTMPSANGYITKASFGFGSYLPLNTVPNSEQASSEYYCDYFNKGANYALTGGNAGSNKFDGVSTLRLNVASNNSYWYLNTSLSCKPLSKGGDDYIPTDPPSPLPAITAYQGENALSSTETVGSVTITGYIKEQGE